MSVFELDNFEQFSTIIKITVKKVYIFFYKCLILLSIMRNFSVFDQTNHEIEFSYFVKKENGG